MNKIQYFSNANQICKGLSKLIACRVVMNSKTWSQCASVNFVATLIVSDAWWALASSTKTSRTCWTQLFSRGWEMRTMMAFLEVWRKNWQRRRMRDHAVKYAWFATVNSLLTKSSQKVSRISMFKRKLNLLCSKSLTKWWEIWRTSRKNAQTN